MDYDDGVLAPQHPKLEPLLRQSPLRSELFLGEPNELGEPLPVLTARIEGQERTRRRRPSGAGVNERKQRKRHKGRGGKVEDPRSHLSCLWRRPRLTITRVLSPDSRCCDSVVLPPRQ